MSLLQGYAMCAVCRHPYRPGVAESVEGHRRATGHTPTTPPGTPDGPARPARPARRADEQPVSPGELLAEAARRITVQRQRLDVLDDLATAWEGSTDPTRAKDGHALRTVLERPPAYALAGLDDDEGDNEGDDEGRTSHDDT